MICFYKKTVPVWEYLCSEWYKFLCNLQITFIILRNLPENETLILSVLFLGRIVQTYNIFKLWCSNLLLKTLTSTIFESLHKVFMFENQNIKNGQFIWLNLVIRGTFLHFVVLWTKLYISAESTEYWRASIFFIHRKFTCLWLGKFVTWNKN